MNFFFLIGKNKQERDMAATPQEQGSRISTTHWLQDCYQKQKKKNLNNNYYNINKYFCQ